MAINTYTSRLAELYEKKQQAFVIHKGVFWHVYNKMIDARHPVDSSIDLTKEDRLFLLKKLNGLLLRSMGQADWQKDILENDWFALLCKENVNLSSISAKKRYEFKKGFKFCEVKRLEISYVAKHAFSVFKKAQQRYKNQASNISEKKFSTDILLEKGFDDLIHYFGVFVSGQLVAYSKIYVFGKTEANIAVLKYDPAFLKSNSSIALAYFQNQYYLDENRVKYINMGMRNIDHNTNVQQFYINRLNFKKVTLPLYIDYSWKLNIPLHILRPLGSLAHRFDPRLKSLLLLDSFANKNIL